MSLGPGATNIANPRMKPCSQMEVSSMKHPDNLSSWTGPEMKSQLLASFRYTIAASIYLSSIPFVRITDIAPKRMLRPA